MAHTSLGDWRRRIWLSKKTKESEVTPEATFSLPETPVDVALVNYLRYRPAALWTRSLKINNEGKIKERRYRHPRSASNEVINSVRRSPRHLPAQHLRKKRVTEARKRPSEGGSPNQRALCTSDFHAPWPPLSGGAVHLLLVLFVRRLCELLPSKHDYAAIRQQQKCFLESDRALRWRRRRSGDRKGRLFRNAGRRENVSVRRARCCQTELVQASNARLG